ncbi:MAG: hypothetical protein M3235_17240 [Actinomycetota bacterium]|nr:hypothetical protein [Actinomycetota bacterium]
MTRRGPLLTLFAVGVLALALLAGNVVRGAGPDLAAQQGPEPPPANAPPGPFPAEAVYTGRSSGDEVTVAIAVRGGRAAAYVCDGASVEVWLDGAVNGPTLTLARDAARITANPDGTDAVFGRVRVDGRDRPYTAQIAPPPAGLYEGRQAGSGGADTRVGWIVLPDGDVVGVLDSGGDTRPAPALDLDRGGATVDGTFVPAEPVSGDRDVTG